MIIPLITTLSHVYLQKIALIDSWLLYSLVSLVTLIRPKDGKKRKKERK